MGSIILASCSLFDEMNTDIYDVEFKLWHSIDNGNLEAVKESIEAGANINMFTKSKYCERTEHNRKVSSPLLQSLSKGKYEIAEYLIMSGADVNYIDGEGESVLQYCAEFYPQIIEMVIAAGADISYTDNSGKSALDYAANYDVDNAQRSSFDVLIEYGAMPTQKTIKELMSNIDISKYGMLRTAIKSVDSEYIDPSVKSAFLNGGVDIVETDDDIVRGGVAAFGAWDILKKHIPNQYVARQLLPVALMYDNKDVVFNLIDKYGDVFNLDNNNDKYRDYLYYAAFNDDIKMIDRVYRCLKGDLANAASNAIRHGNNNVLCYFLDSGMDPNSKVFEGTLLTACCVYKNYEAAMLLLEYGAEANDEALTRACAKGNEEIAELLLKYGANANCKNYYLDGSGGYSALLQSIDAGQFECVKLLVENGADIYHEYYGKNSIEKARENDSERIYKYFLSIQTDRGTVLLSG